MREWLPRLAVLACLGLILGVPLALSKPLRRGAREAGRDPNRPRLVVLSPHSEQIRYEIGRGFDAWRASRGEPAVELDWRSSGGSSDLRNQVFDAFRPLAASGREDEGIGYDLFFGGGDFEHNNLARGVKVRRGGVEVQVSTTEAVSLPGGVFAEAFPEPAIGGVPLYHPEKKWVGVVLSSFGIIYNRDALALIDRPPPATWDDLADPAYRRWLALADPAHSGSIAVTYNVIVRRLGWTEGWATLRRMFANARYFTSSAAKVPVDVSAGEAAAGMCIDFYGRFQAGAVGDRVGYLDPVHMTAVTPDPISVLRGAPHRELANAFIAWLLSRDAQALWQRRVGVPAPGWPERFELRRLPIRRDLYYRPEETARWTDRTDPFEVASPLPEGMPDFYGLIAPVSHALAIDIHDDLKAAWSAILAHPEHPRIAEMRRLFDAMPAELTLTWPDPELAEGWAAILQAPDHPRHAEAVAVLKRFAEGLTGRYRGADAADRRLSDAEAWTRFFRGNYRKIVEIARE